MRYKLKLIVTKIRRRVLAGQATFFRFYCPVCRVETELLTAAESVALLEIENRLLERLITDGKIHAIQTVSGNLRVCKNSLFQK